MYMTAFEAGCGDVGFSALPDTCAAGGTRNEVGFAFAADPSLEVSGEMGSGTHCYLASEVDIPLGEFWIVLEDLLRLLEKNANPLSGDLLWLSLGHLNCLFIGFLGWDRVYKSMVGIWFLERGGAAR